MLVCSTGRAGFGRTPWHVQAALYLSLSVASLSFLLACAGGAAEGKPATATASTAGLTVRRGDFQERHLLSGELVARRAEVLSVPRTRSWQVQIRWMERDGAEVAAGQKLVEFDNASFVSDLEEKQLEAERSAHDLERLEVETAATLAEKRFAVERQRSEVAKTDLAAGVPEGLLAARELQDRRLALARAQAELDKALADLEAQQRASAAALGLEYVKLAKARREIATAEDGVRRLTLYAPRAGVVVAGTHPWQPRKIQPGDTVWVGLPVMTLPELSSMAVQAALFDVDDGRVRAGMPAVCVLDAYPGERFPGRVTAVAPMARELSEHSELRLFRVDVALERVDRERMRPGLSVRVEVLGERRAGALLAPRAGLDLAASPPRARLAGGATRPLRLGPCGPHDCVVLQGLAAGERLRSAAADIGP
jgi:multidrug efflux pump subunit AcrA (membrane-fusion protein)